LTRKAVYVLCCFVRRFNWLRAAIRGIDLILEEGMNVKVCTFPDDPDSFIKNISWWSSSVSDENAKDFIQFKASTHGWGKMIPLKADLIRDMVTSI
jgi:DNA primase